MNCVAHPQNLMVGGQVLFLGSGIASALGMLSSRVLKLSLLTWRKLPGMALVDIYTSSTKKILRRGGR